MELIYYENAIRMEEAFVDFEFSLDYIPIAEASLPNIGNKLDLIFKAVIHFFKEVKSILESYTVSRDTANLFVFIEQTLKKYPNLGKEIITIRDYEKAENNLKNSQTYMRNLATRSALAITDVRLYNLLANYHFETGGRDLFREVKLKDVPDIISEMAQIIENDRNEVIRNLFKFKEKVKEYENEPGFIESVKSILKNITDSFKKRINIINYNYEAMIYELHKTTKNSVDEASAKVRRVPSRKTLVKNSTYYKSIKVGDTTFDLYKLPYDHIACFNYKGTNIYLDESFFKYPIGYQKAILYHEIGHYKSGHFGDIEGVTDEFKQMKRIRSDMYKFDRLVKASEFNPTKALNDDSELLYILIELDADRYSSLDVGKTMMKKGLTTKFKDMLDHDLGAQKNKDMYDYNIDRMKFRTSMI